MQIGQETTNNSASKMTSMEGFGDVGRGEFHNYSLTFTTRRCSICCRVFQDLGNDKFGKKGFGKEKLQESSSRDGGVNVIIGRELKDKR